MIEARGGPTFFEIDSLASEPYKPHAVITADCSGAREFDDAISVKAYPTHAERYRVTVCTVDTSHLFFNDEILKDVIQKTESMYHDPKTGKDAYEPMLPHDITQELHFAAGAVRKALFISFLIGDDLPPSDIQLEFGRVEVVKNFKYNLFGDKCRYSPNLDKYGMAAAQIFSHLDLTKESLDQEAAHKKLVHVSKDERWKRGSTINQAYMVAAGLMVGTVMEQENRLAIYRTHDRKDTSLSKILPPDIARYDTEPRPHEGLNLPVYCRTTSPLRRAEDFMNVGLLKLRQKDRDPNARDIRKVNEVLQNLNAREAGDYYRSLTEDKTAQVIQLRRRNTAI